MRAWIISDIHLKQRHALDLWKAFPIPQADIAIIAGDVCNGFASGIHWIANVIAPAMPVYFVLGNHDCYGTSVGRAIEEVRFLSRYSDITLLENDVVELGRVRLIGATLWTDFELPVSGVYEQMSPQEKREAVYHVLPRELMDFMEINRSDERKEGETGFITIQEMIARHHESRAFIDHALAKPFDGKSVVITHHAPLGQSINPKYEGDIANTGFASDLSMLIESRAPDIWIHGHVHHFLDYRFDKTRVICNPKGVFGEQSNFQWDFVIDL
jgi:Icc-related predicted phosphoesterase